MRTTARQGVESRVRVSRVDPLPSQLGALLERVALERRVDGRIDLAVQSLTRVRGVACARAYGVDASSRLLHLLATSNLDEPVTSAVVSLDGAEPAARAGLTGEMQVSARGLAQELALPVKRGATTSFVLLLDMARRLDRLRRAELHWFASVLGALLGPAREDGGAPEREGDRETEHEAETDDAARMPMRAEARTLGLSFDRSFDAAWLLSPRGRVIDANEAALAALPVGEFAALGRPLQEALWWAHGRAAVAEAVSAAARGVIGHAEAVVRSGIRVAVTVRPLVDSAGRVTAVVAELHRYLQTRMD